MKQAHFRYGYIDFLRILSAFAVICLHCLISVNESTDFLFAAVTNSLYNIFRLSVPIFIMITGALLLSNDRKYTYGQIFKKYVLRALLCLFVFGTLFALMELVATARSFNLGMLPTAFLYMLTGRSFDHLWYLYMLIGLYLMTPVLKPFLKTSSKRTVEIFLALLFTANYLFPCINALFGIEVAFYIQIIKPHVFYYVLGYYTMVYAPDIKNARTAALRILISAACLSVLSVCVTAYSELAVLAEIDSPFGIAIVYNTYLLARKYISRPRKIYAFMAPLVLWIYIIHPVFIHAFRLLGISTENCPPLYPLLVIAVSALSTACAYVMNKCIVRVTAPQRNLCKK